MKLWILFLCAAVFSTDQKNIWERNCGCSCLKCCAGTVCFIIGSAAIVGGTAYYMYSGTMQEACDHPSSTANLLVSQPPAEYVNAFGMCTSMAALNAKLVAKMLRDACNVPTNRLIPKVKTWWNTQKCTKEIADKHEQQKQTYLKENEEDVLNLKKEGIDWLCDNGDLPMFEGKLGCCCYGSPACETRCPATCSKYSFDRKEESYTHEGKTHTYTSGFQCTCEGCLRKID